MTANVSILSGAGLRLRPALVLPLASIAAVMVLALATRWGIGASPDSAVYLGVARNLVSGRGLTVPFGGMNDSPLTQFPPLYPAVLAGIGTAGIEPEQAARGLNAALLVANACLVAWMVLRVAPRSRDAPAVAAIFLMASPSILSIHVMAWSEPLFLALGLLGMALAAMWAEGRSPLWFAGSALVLGLCSLTRFAGVAFVATAALGVAVARRGSILNKALAGAALGIAGCLPLAIWLGSVWQAQGAEAVRQFGFHPIGAQQSRQLLETAASWLLMPPAAPSILKALGVVAVALILACGWVLWWRQRRSGPGVDLEASRRPSILLGFVGLFPFIYLVFLATSISFFDANTPLDARILSPMYVVALVLAAPSIESLGNALPRRRLVAAAAALTAGGLILLAAARSAQLALSGYQDGIGFNASPWRRSETLAWVGRLPGDTLIYSNSPEAVYLHTGRSAVRIPRIFRLADQTANERYGSELAMMGSALLEQRGLVVMFSGVRGSSMPSEADLRRDLALTPVFEGADGGVYALAPAR